MKPTIQKRGAQHPFTQRLGRALAYVAIGLASLGAPSAQGQTNTNDCTAAPAGLVGWWRGEGDASDAVGNVPGSPFGGTAFAPGLVGQAFNFDGVNDCVVNTMPGLTNIQESFTMEFWAYPTAGRATTPESTSGIAGISNQRYAIYPLNGELGPVGAGVSVGTNGISVFEHGYVYLASLLVYDAPIIGWTHVAVVYENRQPRLYLNGNLVRTGLVSTRPPFPSTWLGEAGPNSLNYGFYSGLLDEVCIYERPLTAAEIQSIYAAGDAGKCTGGVTNPPPTAAGVPVITSFSPAAATVGSAVFIPGNNFSPVAASNIVCFGAVRALVIAASPTNLIVTLPVGATHAPISVTVNGQTALSPLSFLPTFAGTGTNITTASFAPGQNLTVADGPIKAVIADLDGDGKPDLVVANAYAHNVSLLRNISAAGTLAGSAFASRVDLPAVGGTDSPRCIAVADVDGDGKLDVLIGDQATSSVIVYQNLATPGALTAGDFAAPVRFAASGNSYPHGLRVADLNGDGRPEILVANQAGDSISILRNLGIAGNLTTNSFAPQFELSAGANPTDVGIADLNGDGRPDLVTTAFNGSQLALFRNVATPDAAVSNWFTFDASLPALAGSLEITMADMDGDAKSDLVVASVHGYAVSVYRNQATAGAFTTNSFAARMDYGTPGWVHTISVADFNGDARPDLAVVGELNSYLGVFPNQSAPGNIMLAPRVDFATGWNAWGVAAGDLDGDHRADIVFANSYDDTLTFYRNIVPFGQPNPPSSCVNPPAGLVSWWKAENDAMDLLNVHNGMLLNGATFTPGIVGQSFGFNGTDAYVNIPGSEALKPTGAFTLEAWIKYSGTPGAISSYCIAAKGIDAEAAMDWALTVSANNRLRPHVSVNGSWHYFDCATPLSAGNWYHVAMIYDGEHLQGYVNGSLDGSANVTGSVQTSDAPLRIGAYAPVNGTGSKAFFTGSIDEVAFYNRHLSAGEVVTLFNAGSAGKCPPTHSPFNPGDGLVAHYPFSGDASDVSGNENHGVPSNVIPAADRFGSPNAAYHFNGQNAAVTVTDNPALRSLTSNYTFNAWVRFGSNPQIDAALLMKSAGAGNQRKWTFWRHVQAPPYGLGLLLNRVPGGQFQWNNDFPFTTNQWFMVTFSASTANTLIAVDGQVVSAQSGNLLLPDTTGLAMSIGGAEPAGNQWFNGLLDDIRIYNRTFSSNDIAQLYQLESEPPLELAAIPAITSFSPMAASVGSSVNISGTNFSSVAANNIVYFGAVRAGVTAASSNSLTVTVPVGATHDPITVTVDGLTAAARTAFTPTFAGGATISTASFSPRVNLGTGDGPIQTAIADLDGDGKPDIAVTDDYGHTLSVYRNISVAGTLDASSFAPRVVLPASAADYSPYMLVTGDVDGDGKLDLITTDVGGNTVSVYRNQSVPGGLSSNSFAPFVSFVTGAGPRSVAVLDLDADGRPEIVTANYDSSTVSVLRHTGGAGPISSNSFAPRFDLPAGTGTHGVTVMDLDGDGLPDLATANAGGASMSLFRNVGSGPVASNSFAPAVNIPAPSNAHFVRAADLDADGRAELLLTSYLGQTLTVYRNQADPGVLNPSSFAAGVTLALAGRGHTISVGDLNGDARPDIAVDTEIGDSIALFQNQSVPGGFTNDSLAARVDLVAGWNAWGASVGDLDGDTRPDVVFANSYDDTLTFYRNIAPFSSVTNPPPQCVDAPVGLAGWWRAENNATDAINTNHASLLNGVSYNLGVVGLSFMFDGIDDSVRVPANSSLDVGIGAGLTIEAWVNPSRLTIGPIAEWNNGAGGEGMHLWHSVDSVVAGDGPGNLYGNLVDTSGVSHGIVSPSGLLVTNAFNHVALTYDKLTGVAVLYHNGVVVKTENLGIFTPRTSDDLHFGRRPAGFFSENLFQGMIDEVSIYNRSLTTGEIHGIFAAGSAGKCAPVVLPPQIAQHPQTIVTNAGASVQFEVVVSGIPTPTYQWFFAGDALSGQTNASLILNNIHPSQSGNYWVRVSNPSGSVLSSNAYLGIISTQAVVLVDGNTPGFYNDSLGTVLDGTAPQFPMPLGIGGDPEFYPADEPPLGPAAAILGNWLSSPPNLNSNWQFTPVIPATWEINTETAIIYPLVAGEYGVMNLRADLDADNGIYVWVNGQYKFGARAPGLPSPIGQFEYTNVFLGDLPPGTNFIQILREDSGVSVGSQIRLTGTWLSTNNLPPSITRQPTNQIVAVGSAFSLSVEASGTPVLQYQWRFNGSNLLGQISSSLPFSNVQLNQAGDYSVVVANAFGSITSSIATLTVVAYPPVITRQPANTNVIVGNTASLSVQATGSGTLAYQWLLEGAPLAGRISPTLNFPSAQFSNAGNYSVIITNPYGVVTSSVATLTVNPIPPCVSVHDGLVSWWRGENNLLDGWDGNNGSAFVTPQYANGKVGRTLVNPTVTVLDALSLRMTNALTIEGWVNPASVSSVRVILSKHEYPPQQPLGTQSAYLLGLTNNGALFFTLTPNGSVRTNTTLVATNLVPINQWSHVAATYDGTIMRIYLNGSQVAQRSHLGGIFPGNTALGIGGFGMGNTSSPWPFTGMLDEISVYNRALSPTEVQAIFSADLTGKCLAPPLITQQPRNQAIPLGEDVKFSVNVQGSRPLAYQWYFNGATPQNRIIGATNAALVIEKVRTNQAGLYFVMVTNSLGADTSLRAELSTLPAPACTEILPGLISWWPGNSNLLDAIGPNNIATYSLPFFATGKVGAAFTFNGISSRIAINNHPSLNFSNDANFSIEMWIRATNTLTQAGFPYPNTPLLEKRTSTTTSWVGYSLSLHQGRLAFAMGTPGTVAPGAVSNYISSGPDLRDTMFHHVAVTVNRTATNGGVLYVDGLPVLTFNPAPLNLSLANTSPLLIGAPMTTFSNSYYAGLIDEPAIYNRALTAAEILSIRTAGAAGRCKAAPVIITQPIGQSVTNGASLTLSVVATGTPAPRYQWRRHTINLSGATNSTLLLTNISNANIGIYSVIVSNAFGGVTSSNAIVAINRLPVANPDSLTTPSNTAAVFPAAKLLLNDTDADGDVLNVASVSGISGQNGTVSLVSNVVTYTPPVNFTGNDTFTYVLTDKPGVTTVGTVMVTVGSGGAAPMNIIAGPTVVDGQFVVRFAGIPGLTYTIETATSVAGPWTKVANLTAPETDTGLGVGIFEFREPVVGEGARYYRTVYPAY